MAINKEDFHNNHEEELIRNLYNGLNFTLEETEIRIQMLKNKTQTNIDIRNSFIKELFIKIINTGNSKQISVIIRALSILTGQTVFYIKKLYESINMENNN